MDHWTILGACASSSSMPAICKFKQGWRCEDLGHLLEEVCKYPHWSYPSCDLCEMGWRWNDLYKVLFVRLSIHFQLNLVYLSMILTKSVIAIIIFPETSIYNIKSNTQVIPIGVLKKSSDMILLTVLYCPGAVLAHR